MGHQISLDNITPIIGPIDLKFDMKLIFGSNGYGVVAGNNVIQTFDTSPAGNVVPWLGTNGQVIKISLDLDLHQNFQLEQKFP
jgi:hypothetical protein